MKKNKFLAGSLTEREFIERSLRVNQAGEYGAKRIYEGQLAVLKGTDAEPILKHMKDQELEHLEYFNNELAKRDIRPSLLHPFWHFGGFALGAVTALMGKKMAMTCTEAVEEVIDRHYQEQLDYLGDNEQELKTKIAKFQADEIEHKNTAIAEGSQDAIGHRIIKKAVSRITKVAVNIAKKI